MDFTEAYYDTCSTVGVAARTGDLCNLQFLIWHGRAVDVKDNRGWRPIHEAAFNGHPGCLEFLLRHANVDPDWKTFEEETAILLAARRGHFECVRTLLDYEANPNIATNEGFTPLWEAVQSESQECVRLLIRKDANINARVYTGYTPLHLAAEKGHFGILQYLINHGANITACADDDLTPLFLTAQFGRTDCLKLLLKTLEQKGLRGFVNKTALDGATPVLIAAQEGHEECISLLLDCGADVNIPVKDFKAVAAHYAIFKNRPRCLQMILPRTNSDAFIVNVNVMMHPLILALQLEDTTCLEILIAAGLNVKKPLPLLQDHFDEVDRNLFFSHLQYKLNASVLCHANYSWPLEGVEFLLRAGLECNPQDSRELPPLLAALSQSSFELYVLLIKYGARTNIYHELIGGNLVMLLAIKNDLVVHVIVNDGITRRKLFGKYICPLLLAGGDAHSCFNTLHYNAATVYNLNSILEQCQLTNWYPLLLILLCLTCNIQLEEKLKTLSVDGQSDGLLHRMQESSHSLAHACRKQIVLSFARHGNYLKEVAD